MSIKRDTKYISFNFSPANTQTLQNPVTTLSQIYVGTTLKQRHVSAGYISEYLDLSRLPQLNFEKLCTVVFLISHNT
jgi:hypothetical protein